MQVATDETEAKPQEVCKAWEQSWGSWFSGVFLGLSTVGVGFSRIFRIFWSWCDLIATFLEQ